MADFLQMLLQQAEASGSKSTVLKDLRWFAGILVVALLGCVKYGAPSWLLVGMASVVGVVTVAYLCAYGYFAHKSPDSLRSEKFTLSKMAIEKSIKGDNLAGLIDPENRKAIEAKATTPEGR